MYTTLSGTTTCPGAWSGKHLWVMTPLTPLYLCCPWCGQRLIRIPEDISLVLDGTPIGFVGFLAAAPFGGQRPQFLIRFA